MPWFTRRMLVGGAASVCIALLGATVVWNTVLREPQITELKSYDETRDASAGASATADIAEPPVDATATGNAANAVATGADVPAPAPQDRGNADAVVEFQARTSESVVASAEPGRRGDELGKGIVTADEDFAEVQVKGVREALANAVEIDRERRAPVVTMKSENISTFPDAQIPEALQRIQGISVAPMPPGAPPPEKAKDEEGRDRFEQFTVNPVKQVAEEPVSTFSADVDTSSYSFVRKQLDQGVLPQKDAVRAEEMINYFDYAWPVPQSRERPFQPTVVVSDSPWTTGRKLIHIGIKGYELPAAARPDANLVLLLDVSGSMDEPDKLPLVRQSMKLLLGSLKQTDTVGIVVYAGAAGVVLEPTAVGNREKIVQALDRLEAGGSTAGGQGIELAYQLAERSFRKQAVNRIILCTDGDFNVGIDSTNELKGFVERKREKGIFLSVLGFGQGNYRDELAQALAQNGNGVAAYIDTLNEARKVLVEEAGSSLFTIARDVKLQVEFNPATVAEYRLIGYETRALRREDFNNDAVDAGDIGAGHTVTAIYEITPVGVDARMVDESRYSKKIDRAPAGKAGEYGFLKIRYKLPGENQSRLIEQPIERKSAKLPEAVSRDVTFSTAVAGFAQLLRGGTYTGSWSYEDVIRQAQASRGEDTFGYRNEFVQLVRKAQVARGM